MGAGVSIPLEALPARRPVTKLDPVLACAAIGLHVALLTTPSTMGWIYFRRAVGLPLVALCYAWVIWVPILSSNEEQWGITCLFVAFTMRLVDHMCFVPEDTHYRIRPDANGVLIREPVPPPFSLPKAYWGLSLFSSWRGIGWSYRSPLSALAHQPPFTRDSDRRSFVIYQLKLIPLLVVLDVSTKTYVRTIGLEFFTNAVSYDSLSFTAKFGHSLAVVARVWWALNVGYVPISVLCVLWAGWVGWEGEFWSPWGWPPIFGGIREIWEYPGLSTMWSRSWNNGGRRWFYAIGWVGIGEKIIRLPSSTVSSHDHKSAPEPIHLLLKPRNSGTSTPATPGDASPAHPIPTTLNRRVSKTVAISNLVKGIIAFSLSGLLHDVGAPLLYLNSDPPATSLDLSYSTLIYTTPFFTIQPIALAVEAVIKRTYRRAKVARGIRKGEEPQWLVFTERLVSFICVWYWICITSRFYVQGVAEMRLHVWDDEPNVMETWVKDRVRQWTT